MSPVIRIGDETHRLLQKFAEPLVDNYDSTIRRGFQTLERQLLSLGYEPSAQGLRLLDTPVKPQRPRGSSRILSDTRGPIRGSQKEAETTLSVVSEEAIVQLITSRSGAKPIRVKRGRYTVGESRVAIHTSKKHHANWPHFWFGVTPTSLDFLQSVRSGYVLFACGSLENVVILPTPEFRRWTSQLVTDKHGRWHVYINEGQEGLELRMSGGVSISLSRFTNTWEVLS